jgi:hypothetical protein
VRIGPAVREERVKPQQGNRARARWTTASAACRTYPSGP